MTPENKRSNEEEFAKAFEQDHAGAAEQTEDEAFGLGDAGSDTPEAQPAVALVIDAKPATEASEPDAEEASESPAEESAEPSLDVAKETQRLKSWEGRLKAREAELKAMAASQSGNQESESSESPADESTEEASENPAEEAGETPEAEDIEEVTESVKSGDMSLDEAKQRLSEDFGDDFVNLIMAIATGVSKDVAGTVAGEHAQSVSQQIDEIVNDLTDSNMRSHFREILRSHPDFNEIADSPEFTEWLRSMPEGERAEAVRVADSGNTDEVIKLLDAYKQQASGQSEETPTDSVDPQQVDAAEGVRSGGLRLPQQPGASEDYASAWDDFQ